MWIVIKKLNESGDEKCLREEPVFAPLDEEGVPQRQNPRSAFFRTGFINVYCINLRFLLYYRNIITIL